MDTNEFHQLIRRLYAVRNMKWPNVWESLGWVTHELGEVYDLLLAQQGGWVRNNPQNHEDFSQERFEEELGDTIFMLIVTGMVTNTDPLRSMQTKILRKIAAENEKAQLLPKEQ